MTNEELIALAVFMGLLAYVVLLLRRLVHRPARRLDPQTHIIVDGSNVMYWGGEPSAQVLVGVLKTLRAQDLIPLVYFDANVGYKLWDRYADAETIARKLRGDPTRIFVVPKGVTADELLLQAAADHGLRVVTNDRFLDWRGQFPQIDDTVALVKGRVHPGGVTFRGLE